MSSSLGRQSSPARAEFLGRQAEALRRRLSPATGLSIKVLAGKIGRHPDTVGAWLAESTTMSGADIDALDRYFLARGDVGFVLDLYGAERALAMTRRAATLKAEAERIERAAEAFRRAVA